MIVSAIRRLPEAIVQWGAALPNGWAIVVYCAHGFGIGRDTAAEPARDRVDARFPEGGITEWAERKPSLRRKRDDYSRS